jgi:RNA polymerase sigma-70 factor (ECF subfamily)
MARMTLLLSIYPTRQSVPNIVTDLSLHPHNGGRFARGSSNPRESVADGEWGRFAIDSSARKMGRTGLNHPSSPTRSVIRAAEGLGEALVENVAAQRRFYDALWPHMPTVLRTAQVLCGGNIAEAEDLAQEAMLKAFKAIDQFHDGTDARAWLLTILRHARVDRIRARATESGTLSLDSLAQEPAGIPPAEEIDRQSVVENPEVVLAGFSDAEVIRALGRLPEEIRWTLLLVDVEGMDHKEAGEILHVPVGTIKSRAHRGRMMLREELLPVARSGRIVREP